MQSALKTVLFLFLCQLLYAEINSDANQIRKIFYADGLQRNGLATGYSFELVRQNSTNNIAGHKLSLSYGMSDNFDLYFRAPYYIANNDSNQIDGLGDVALGLKYILNPASDGLFHSFLGKITLPTGNDRLNPNLDGEIAYGKKSFELAYLATYRKDFLAVHGNIGMTVLDNISNRDPQDLSFNYKLGFDYRVFEYEKRSMWLKWEFETTNSLIEYPTYIRGSQFLGVAVNSRNGFALHGGVIQQLYDEKGLGFQTGINYLLPGTLREKPKKIFELYPAELKVGLCEFIQDDTLLTRKYLASELQEKLSKTDSVKIVLLPRGSQNFLKNRDRLTAQALAENQNLLIYGKVLESRFTKGNLFRIPALFMIPSIWHQIKLEIIVLDTKTNKIIMQDIIKSESYLTNWPRFLTVSSEDNKWFLNALEENQLIKENSARLTNEIAARLSGRY